MRGSEGEFSKRKTGTLHDCDCPRFLLVCRRLLRAIDNKHGQRNSLRIQFQPKLRLVNCGE